MSLLKLLLPLAAVLAVGCAGNVQYQKPPAGLAQDTGHRIEHSVLLDRTDHMVMHLNENKDIVYQQNFGGGGAAAGVLLGPLGVAANISAIKSNTNEDVARLKGKIGINPDQLFIDVVQARSEGFVVDGGNTLISPYVYLSKFQDEQLHLGSAFIVESADGTGGVWQGRYFYQTDLVLTLSELEDGLSSEELVKMNQALSEGYSALIALYEQDRRQELAALKTVRFKSDFVSPRFMLEFGGEQLVSTSDRFNVRAVNAVYSLPADGVEITYSKAPEAK